MFEKIAETKRPILVHCNLGFAKMFGYLINVLILVLSWSLGLVSKLSWPLSQCVREPHLINVHNTMSRGLCLDVNSDLQVLILIMDAMVLTFIPQHSSVKSFKIFSGLSAAQQVEVQNFINKHYGLVSFRATAQHRFLPGMRRSGFADRRPVMHCSGNAVLRSLRSSLFRSSQPNLRQSYDILRIASPQIVSQCK